ncbi:glycoside hydrolase family 76 protein [Mucilaginibacter sp. BJC16-A38]|uniref:glycoside hydrolase family 76 protein n=1 Tax=Mucilaginibacter phenanthrenivorans TaxID=1234842 RepID=UPI002157B845|nr:glycoside hydrolase family 76 protein [Mucilaginibacter phenanthrenivorans]MCR8556268.1 glycoside hydrolase family 76 protein [Mucilaginibacter phenanthrenivorans]
MDLKPVKIWPMLVFLTGILMSQEVADAQQRTKSAEYLRRAELMYNNIQKYYRVPAHPHLYLENFPSSKHDSLDYMQGSKVKEKEVSFLWPYSGVFSATNVLLHIPSQRKKYLPYLADMAAGMETYRDTTRMPVGYQAYPSMFEKADRYYDDNGLVGIEYMESYFNTKSAVYLNRAKDVFKFIISGWDDRLGGGVYWVEGHKDQKPACSNGMDLLVAFKLYKATRDSYYLTWGKRFYNWMEANLRNPDGVFYNDKKTTDGAVNETYWTYNSGAVLEAAVMLYQFTGEKKYLAEAQIIAKNTTQHFIDLKHDANLSMQIDLPWFVTVLARGYQALYKVGGNYVYLSALEKNLDYAWENTRDKYGFLTKSWTTNATEMAKPKWLLDEACIAELYARLSEVESGRK